MKIILLITFILLISLAFTLDLSLLRETISDINLVFLALSLIPIVLEILIKSTRLRVLVLAFTRINLSSATIVTLVGFPFGTVTPGRVGDIIKVHTLSEKTSLPLEKSFGIGFFEKALELFSLSLLVILGIVGLAFSGIFGKQLAFFFAAALAIIILLVLVFHQRLTEKLLRFAVLRFLPARYHLSFDNLLASFYSTLTTLRNHLPILTSVIFLSMLLWLNRILQVFLFSLALGMNVHLYLFFLIMPLAFVAEIIPITIMGLGVREYLYLFLFSLIGITQETSVVLSLLVFTFGILPPAVIGYFVVLKEYGGIVKMRKAMGI